MTAGLILLFTGLVLWVIESKIVVHLSDPRNKFVARHEKLVNVVGLGFIAVCILMALAGLIIVFINKWWAAIFLFFFVVPYIVKNVAE